MSATTPEELSIGFVLQPHFSLMAFTAAADALTTASLVTKPKRYRFTTIGLGARSSGRSVTSDLGIPVQADLRLPARQAGLFQSLDAIIVCGGYRCTLNEDALMSSFLTQAAASTMMLGGIWNGIIALAHANLMSNYACALHPGDHDVARKRFPLLEIRNEATVIDRDRLSAAGPSSSLDLMAALIQRHDGAEVVQAVRNILRADISAPQAEQEALARDHEHRLPASLQLTLQLMRNNLDEPIEREELARHANLSTRALERLFQTHLQTSPARHYLELRLQSARQLLLKGKTTIGEVSNSCGFVSNAHFSRAFAKRFGKSPREFRDSAFNRT